MTAEIDDRQTLLKEYAVIKEKVESSEKLRDHEKPRIARLSAGNKAVEPRELITEDHVKLISMRAVFLSHLEEDSSIFS